MVGRYSVDGNNHIPDIESPSNSNNIFAKQNEIKMTYLK